MLKDSVYLTLEILFTSLDDYWINWSYNISIHVTHINLSLTFSPWFCNTNDRQQYNISDYDQAMEMSLQTNICTLYRHF